MALPLATDMRWEREAVLMRPHMSPHRPIGDRFIILRIQTHPFGWRSTLLSQEDEWKEVEPPSALPNQSTKA